MTMSLRLSSVPVSAGVFAGYALPIFPKVEVSVFLGELVPMLAMRFAKVRAHCQAFVKHTVLWVEQFFHRLAFSGASNNRVHFQASKFRKQRCLVLHAFHSNHDGVAPIKHLLFAACPATIRWFIISVIVNALNGVSGRRLSHVLKERDEAVSPTVADGYTSATVGRVSIAFRIEASLLHLNPSTIKLVGAEGVPLVSHADIVIQKQEAFQCP